MIVFRRFLKLSFFVLQHIWLKTKEINHVSPFSGMDLMHDSSAGVTWADISTFIQLVDYQELDVSRMLPSYVW